MLYQILISIFILLFFFMYFNTYFYEYFDQTIYKDFNINKEDNIHKDVNINEYKYLMLNNNKKNLYDIELGDSIGVYSEDCYDKCNERSCIELDQRKKILNNCLKCNMQKNKCYDKSIIGGLCNDCSIENIDDKINCYDTNNFGCPSIKNIDNNNGVIPYYIQVADNNINSPFNKKCVFCWNIQNSI